MFFGSHASAKKKVSLGGKSAKEQSRDDVLEQARLERDRRKRQKLEETSCKTIQAHWRRVLAVRRLKLRLRASWEQTFGPAAERADITCMQSGSGFLRSLLRWCDVSQQADVGKLAGACRCLVAAVRTPEGAASLQHGLQGPDRAVMLLRLRGLALLCLQALAQHSDAFRGVLSRPRSASASSLDPAHQAARALAECLMLLTSPSSQDWGQAQGAQVQGQQQAAGVGPAAAGALVSRTVLLHLLQRGDVFRLLLQLLLDNTPPPGASPALPAATAPGTSPTAAGVVSYAESLCTHLTVQLFKHAGSTTTASSGTSSLPGSGAGLPGLHLLLCLPGLWGRVGSLKPVAGRIVRLAVLELADKCQEAAATASGSGAVAALVSALPDGVPGGKAAAAAALVANILAVGLTALPAAPAAGSSPTAGATAVAPSTPAVALAMVQTLHITMSVLPRRPFFEQYSTTTGTVAGSTAAPTTVITQAAGASKSASAPAGSAPGGAAADGDVEMETVDTAVAPGAGAEPSASASASRSGGGRQLQTPPQVQGPEGRLRWSPGAPIPEVAVEGVRQLWDQTGAVLLRRLVALLLPAASEADWQADAGLAGQVLGLGTGVGAAEGYLRYAAGAYALCQFLQQLLLAPAHKRRLLLFLAVGMDFVPRLWFSLMQPSRAAALALRTTSSSTSRPATAWYTPGPSPTTAAQLPGSASSSLPATTPSTSGYTGYANPPSTSTHAGGSVRPGAGPAGGRPAEGEVAGWVLPLHLLCQAFSSHLMTADLDEFYKYERPLPLRQLYDAARPEAGLLALIRDSLWQVLWQDPDKAQLALPFAASDPTSDSDTDEGGSHGPGYKAMLGPGGSNSHTQDQQGAHGSAGTVGSISASVALYRELVESAGGLYKQLYERACRREFAPVEAFHARGLVGDALVQAATGRGRSGGIDSEQTRVWQVLRHAPSLIPFQERAQLFQSTLSEDREAHYMMQLQGQQQRMEALLRAEEAVMDGHMSIAALQQQQQQAELSASNRFVSIRRGHVLEDGYSRLFPMGQALKGRVRVQFISEHGDAEAGVDGGGLFKDFLESLVKEGFNSELGLFVPNAANELYPNPAAAVVVEDAPRLLEFLGRMLGKAVYEGILVELRFAGFFLKQFRSGSRCDVNDLPTLDPELYRNLMTLRHYNGNVADLSLTFTVTDSAAGQNREVELKPGGQHITVTNDNVVEYIHRVADYRLNKQLAGPTSAFLRGFFALVPRDWVSMFTAEELQLLIGGSEEGVDLQDMRRHVNYAGGYHEDHPVVHCFWDAMATFTPQEQRALLRFVTSCSRAPLLGFRYLEPQLCIQMAGGMLDESSVERLPTASTCMNLLKLPPYRTVQTMRDKLLYAVQSGAGFDLS